MVPPGEVVLGLEKGRVRHIVRGEGELVDGSSHPCPHLHQDHRHLLRPHRAHLASKAGER